ncbi:MAG TPA: hypothetical protein VGQ69_15625 [Gemmatimonadales bacterium]|jgi:hypothetical protein|nr:hypothetical protein [Gemmatimonadales bacterium]
MLSAVLLLAGLAACSNSLAPGDQARVNIAFRVLPSANSLSGPLVISGSNGTLTITDISLIVNEFELEGDEDACEAQGSDDDCEEFEAPAAFVRLPLDGDRLVTVSTLVPAGTYHSLEFEVEDVDLDEPDDDAGDISSVAAAVRAAFPNWPDEASMVVVGSFTPTGGQPVPFTVFFEAEIEIEKNFTPPLVVDQGNETITIELDPAVWFRRFDGTVLDLSAFDFLRTGDVVEFEAELENGFQTIEFDD